MGLNVAPGHLRLPLIVLFVFRIGTRIRVVTVAGFLDPRPGSVPTFSDRNLGDGCSQDLESDPDSDPRLGQGLGR